MSTNEAHTELEIEADAAAVWRALTTDEGLAAWMGDGTTIDPTPGGNIVTPDPAGGRERTGEVERVERDQRLEFTWWPTADPDDRSYVSITLEPVEVGTRVRVVERPLSPVLALATPSVRRGAWAWRGASLTLTCRSVRV